MADAPDSSTYILTSQDTANLPNSRIIASDPAASNLQFLDSGPGGNLTAVTTGNLASLSDIATSGFISYNNGAGTFSARTLVSDGSIDIVNPTGVGGNTSLSVNRSQGGLPIALQLNGNAIGSAATLNFEEGSNVDLALSIMSNIGTLRITANSGGGSSNATYLCQTGTDLPSSGINLGANGAMLGIGTTTPSFGLHLVGTASMSGAVTMASTLGVTGLATLGSASITGTLGVTGVTTLSTLGVTGNSGLNTGSANSFTINTLTVSNTGTVANNWTVSGSLITNTINTNNTTALVLNVNGSPRLTLGNDSILTVPDPAVLRNSANSTSINFANGNITSNGSWACGGAQLQVSGNFILNSGSINTGNTNPFLFLVNGSQKLSIENNGVVTVNAGNFAVQAGSIILSGGILNTANTTALSFQTSSTERLRLANDGLVTISGTTSGAACVNVLHGNIRTLDGNILSSGDLSASGTLIINGSTVIDSSRNIVNAVTGSFSGTLTALSLFSTNGSIATGAPSMSFMVNGNTGLFLDDQGFLTVNGNGMSIPGSDTATKLTTTAWQLTSDIRIKTNVMDVEEALPLINAIHPCKYNYTADHISYLGTDEFSTDDVFYGFIADEVETVIPSCITVTNNVSGEHENLKQFNIHNIHIIMVKAMQELSALVTEQNAQIEMLKTQISSLLS